MFEQAAYAPQLPDHLAVRSGNDRPAAKEKPPHVFGHGESGNGCLIHKPRILVIAEAQCPAPMETGSACTVFCLHVFAFKREKRSAERLESRGEAFGRLVYLASDRYQPVKNNPHRKANDTCKQYWHM